MKGMAAATVPAVSAMPLAAASGCPSRTISSACASPTSGALSAGIPVLTCPGHPLHCFAGDTTAGVTDGEETSESGATVVRRRRIRRQGRTRSIGD